jgi:hypothetical protein
MKSFNCFLCILSIFLLGCPLEKFDSSYTDLNEIILTKDKNNEISVNESISFTFKGSLENEKYDSLEIDFVFLLKKENSDYKKSNCFESDSFNNLEYNLGKVIIDSTQFENINKTINIKLTAIGRYEILCRMLAIPKAPNDIKGLVTRTFHVDVK